MVYRSMDLPLPGPLERPRWLHGHNHECHLRLHCGAERLGGWVGHCVHPSRCAGGFGRWLGACLKWFGCHLFVRWKCFLKVHFETLWYVMFRCYVAILAVLCFFVSRIAGFLRCFLKLQNWKSSRDQAAQPRDLHPQALLGPEGVLLNSFKSGGKNHQLFHGHGDMPIFSAW